MEEESDESRELSEWSPPDVDEWGQSKLQDRHFNSVSLYEIDAKLINS